MAPGQSPENVFAKRFCVFFILWRFL